MNIINFSAGPCQLSKSVLEIASKDIINYNQTGISICELSHHTELWKDLYKASKNFKIEWLWVKAHAGNPINEEVDNLAKKAASLK